MIQQAVSHNFVKWVCQVSSHVVAHHILGSIAWVLGIAKLLTLAKLSRGIWPIMMGEVLYRLMSRTLCL